MTSHRRSSVAVWLATAAAVSLSLPAAAQQTVAQATRPAPGAPASQSAAVTPGGGQPTLLGQYGDWGAYSAASTGRKVCFTLSKPTTSATVPPNRPRDPAYLFISSRPAEKVREEVSVIIGYGFKPSSDATVEVGGSAFAMYTQNDGAWIKNAAEEARLVDAMRRGAEVVVKGVSARGTATTDTYSLKGLSQALDRVGQECR